MTYRKALLMGLCVAALAGCGGGGGGSDDDSGGGDSNDSADPTDDETVDVQAFNRAHLDQINATVPQVAGMNGEGARVAILDSGYNGGHDEFDGRDVYGYDALANNGDRTYTGAADTDISGHGTGVSSLALGQNVGVAPEAAFSMYKVANTTGARLGEIRETDVRESLQQALTDNDVDVVNMSFTVNLRANVAGAPTREFVLEGIREQDWIVVVGGGNTGQGLAQDAAGYVDSPAFEGQLLAVGSVRENNRLAASSATATSQLDSAEGWGDQAGVLERWLVAPGADTCTAAIQPNAGSTCGFSTVEGLSGDQSYRRRGGTSYAAPLVSGAVAVIRGAYPSLDGSEIVDILLDSATDLGDPGVDATYGAGLLNVQAALVLAAERTDRPADDDAS